MTLQSTRYPVSKGPAKIPVKTRFVEPVQTTRVDAVQRPLRESVETMSRAGRSPTPGARSDSFSLTKRAWRTRTLLSNSLHIVVVYEVFEKYLELLPHLPRSVLRYAATIRQCIP